MKKTSALALFALLLEFCFIYSQELDTNRITKIDSSIIENDSSGLKYRLMPFAFYHNAIGWIIGGFGGIKGFPQEQTQYKMGGVFSTNGSIYGFCQIEDFQLPFFPRIYLRPDLYGGRLGEIKEYIGLPVNGILPGSNESDASSFILMEGTDIWLEFTVKYLLPIGDGKDKVILNPKFKKGILISGEAGGKEFNPFTSGRTFLSTRFIYRSTDLKNNSIAINMTTAATDFSLTYENVDYYFNPACGSIIKLSYIKDWGVLESNSKSDMARFDFRWFIPLYDRKSNSLPRVLAFNFLTSDVLSWNDYEIIDGKKSYLRPQIMSGSNLGGIRYLRAYKDFRFYDRSLIYYSVEYRQNLPWNIFDYTAITRWFGVDFMQAVVFADLGRVAPEWNLSTLHSNMKYSIGGGIRLFIDGIVARLDLGYGKEGFITQMYVDHPF